MSAIMLFKNDYPVIILVIHSLKASRERFIFHLLINLKLINTTSVLFQAFIIESSLVAEGYQQKQRVFCSAPNLSQNFLRGQANAQQL